MLFLLLNGAFALITFGIKSPFPAYNRFFSVELFKREVVVEVEKPPVSGSIIDVGITDSADIRRIVWQGAWDIAKAYPLFGTGPETFAYAYYKYRPAAHNLTSEWDFLYNRAHNEFLNLAATSGFVGLITYGLLIAAVFRYAYVHFLRSDRHVGLFAALVAGYASILVTNFFGFSVVIIGLFFFLIPAFLYTLSEPLSEETIKTPHMDTRTSLLLIGILALAGYGLVSIGNYWVNDSLYARAYNLKRQENFEEARYFISKATSMRPGEPVYHDERAQIAAGLASIALTQGEATAAATLAKEAINESSRALEISPQNVNFWKTRTRILYQLVAFDPDFITHALDAIRVAQQLAPTDVKIAYNLAVIQGDAGQKSEAIRTLEKAIEIKPDYRDAYIALAIFYEEEKQIDAARTILTKVLERINPNDQEVTERLEKLNQANSK